MLDGPFATGCPINCASPDESSASALSLFGQSAQAGDALIVCDGLAGCRCHAIGISVFWRLREMKIRSLAAPLWLSALVSIVPVSGYAFNLAQLLGRGEGQELNTFKLIHVADLKALFKHSDKV